MKRMNKMAVFSTALTVLAVICIFTTALPAMANAWEPVVYFADAGESPGSVYKVENGTESTYYTRTGGRLYNFAFSPEGILYYSNANDYDLYKLEAGTESLVYHHDTWVRDVGFDSEGRIYFSASCGGDGYIYRLEDGVASLYYTVLLSDVGFWAGDFTFDQYGNLYLSNGNVAGANIYKVVDAVPQIVFSAPNDESIKGISFSSAENVFYASWHGGNIYQVDLSTGERELFYSNLDHLWLSDVFVELSTITGKVMYNGRPVTDYTDSPATIWARNENTGQALPISHQYNISDGTYSIPNVPPGNYGISVRIDDAEPFDGRPFPGDYEGWNSPVVVTAGQPVVNKDLPCEKTIHLTAPVDNLSEIGLVPPPYDTYYQEEMLFLWDAIVEASSYEIRVDKYQSSPYSIIETVYSEVTSNTQTTIIFDDSLENQNYQFKLYARNPSGLIVGKLMVVYSNGCGWDYRFRVLSGGGPCEGDFDGDGDVDGSDLAALAANPDLLDLSVFASGFGKTDCPIIVTLNSTSGLDGYVTSGESAVTWSCQAMVGDSGANVAVRGFLSFDISSLPPCANIISATLKAYQEGVIGTPFADLGNVIVDHLDYGTTLDWADYDLPALQSNVGTLSNNVAIEYKTLDVTTRVATDINDGRARSQYRLLFPIPTDDDDSEDSAFFTSAYCGGPNLPELVVTYQVPTAP